MAAKRIQISMDKEMLRRIDRDPEARKWGRSAFVRSAVESYLATKRRRTIDQEIARAYEGEADSMLTEIADLIQWNPELKSGPSL